MPVPDENSNPYFDVVFGSSGDLTTVPDAIQPSGSISYTQGWGPFYAQDPTVNPATALFIDRAQTNQLFNDLTKALQAYQQFGTPAFITSAMNGGTPFTYAQYARVVHGGVVYQSLVAGNTDSPPSSKWTINTGRTILAGAATFYVATTGNDITGNGTVGTPWQTIQHAINYVADNIDLSGFTATIQVEDGTYSESVGVGMAWVGGGPSSVVIDGNSGTPTNVILTSASSSSALTVTGTGCGLRIQNLKIQNTSTGPAITVGQSANLTMGAGVVFGVAGSAHISGQDNGKFFASNNYTITGAAVNHIVSGINASINTNSITVTITGTPAFSGSYVDAYDNGTIYALGMTFTGSATGVRYAATGNGVIDTGGGGASYFPGSSGGSVSSGGQYI